MQIETERLLLVPLTVEQIWLWVKNIPALEEAVHCSYQAEPMEGAFVKVVEKQAEKAAADEKNLLFYTFWFLVRKADCVVVGSAYFKNKPDKNGEIEIGYGLGMDWEWILSTPDI